LQPTPGLIGFSRYRIKEQNNIKKKKKEERKKKKKAR
jgi:hypothetical protein